MSKILICTILWMSTLLAQNETLPQLIEHVSASVVKIKVQRSEPVDENELVQSDAGGSGFVFLAPTYVITNAHVIKNSQRISLVDNQGNEYSAEVVGKDDLTDIAVLHAPSLKSNVLVPSNDPNVKAGENVFAVGAPYSLDFSATYGIVSAVDRVLANYPYVRFIQTDAAINPGNSGGPLFNDRGQVIGLIATFFSKQGNYTNHGFAIPISKASLIAQKIIDNKRVHRGSLGAELVISERIARKIGYPYGIYCSHTEEGRAAYNAGLRSGDLIISLNDKNLNDIGEFHRALESAKPEDAFRIGYIRNKEKREALIIMDKDGTAFQERLSNAGSGDTAEKTGFIVEPKTLNVLLAFGDASAAGVETGDRIVMLNSNRLKSLKEFNEALGKLKEYETAILQVLRKGESINLVFSQLKKSKGYATLN